MYFVSNTLDDIVSYGKHVYRRASILLWMKTTLLLETIVRFHNGCTVRFILLVCIPPLLIHETVLTESLNRENREFEALLPSLQSDRTQF